MNEFAEKISSISGAMLDDAEAAVKKKVPTEKDAVLDMLDYRLSRKEKQITAAVNAEQKKKLQYQKEEILIIIEKVQEMKRNESLSGQQ